MWAHLYQHEILEVPTNYYTVTIDQPYAIWLKFKVKHIITT
jgi:hypothetical protein